MIKAILEFLTPIIHDGRTRFLIGFSGIGGEVLAAKYSPDNIPIILSIAAITITYIVLKTISNIKAEKK